MLEDGLKILKGNAAVTVFLLDPSSGTFRPVFRAGQPGADDVIPGDGALPRLLAEEAAPLTRIVLEALARESSGERRRLASEALAQSVRFPTELAVPLSRDGRLAGWVAVGGGRPETYLRPEVATAFLAVGHQTVASLERLEALEVARRREALAAVGEMAAGLAHEIRNPLGAIQGAAQVIASESDGRRSREMLEVIEEEAGRLGRVVGDFLDYARPASRRREPIDLLDLAGRAVRAAEAAGACLRVTARAASGTLAAAGDPDQILRAFANLIRNAREAAGPEGALEIEVLPEGQGRVAIRFRDDGPGISPEALPRLFQPFFTTKQGGHGLGLALVHRIVEAHGGEVCVESRPGSGTTFTLILPAYAPAGARSS